VVPDHPAFLRNGFTGAFLPPSLRKLTAQSQAENRVVASRSNFREKRSDFNAWAYGALGGRTHLLRFQWVTAFH
jgi:hypothetical protein